MMPKKVLSAPIFLCFLLYGLALIGCRPDKPAEEQVQTPAVTTQWDSTTVKYAETFELEYHKGYKLIKVKQPYPAATRPYTYLLLPHGQPSPIR